MTNEEVQELYGKIVAVKDKYAAGIMTIEGVNSIGIRVFDQTIVVYAHDITPETLLLIPTELEGFGVECVGSDSNQSAVANSPDYNISLTYQRPIVPGRSLCRTYWGGGGTLGAFFWSNTLQRNVGHSNHHVLGYFNQTFKSQNSNNSVDFTVVPGGVPFDGIDFDDRMLDDPHLYFRWRRYHLESSFTPIMDRLWRTDYYAHADYGQPNGTVHIDSISPTSAKAGEIVLVKIHVGGNHRGDSDILFNGVKAKIKSWTYTHDPTQPVNPTTFADMFELIAVVEAYVPDIPAGVVQIIAHIEGETVEMPAKDGPGYDQACITGNVADWYPITNTSAPSLDSALVTFYPDVPLKLEYIYASAINGLGLGEGAYCNSDINLESPSRFTTFAGGFQVGRQYRNQGLYDGPFYEGMVLMKTGRTTGTTFGIVQDASYLTAYSVNDSNYKVTTNMIYTTDTLYFYANEFINPYTYEDPEFQDWITTPTLNFEGVGMPMGDSGDSGSAVFTATWEDYVAFCNKYGIIVRTRRADLPTDPPAGMLTSTFQYGNKALGTGGGQKAYQYMDYHGLSLARLPMEIAGTATKSTTTSSVSFSMYVPWGGAMNIISTSNMYVDIHVFNIIETSIELVPHIVPTDITQINFDMVGYLKELDTFAPISPDISIGLTINEAIVTPLQMSTNSTLNMPVSISLAINTGGAIQLSAISAISIPVIVGISINAVTVLELSANAPISIQTSVNLTVNEKGFIEISTSLPINIQTSINLTVNEYGFIEISANLPINIRTYVGLKILNRSQLIITHRSSKYIITEILDKYNFMEMINKYIVKEDD